MAELFLSTLSLRRATDTRHGRAGAAGNFYPRSPCGERPGAGCSIWHTPSISIHALLAESDGYPARPGRGSRQFLSTLSLRRATCAGSCPVRRSVYFYPRSPCGERLRTRRCSHDRADFYPRSPCGERPCARCIWRMCGNISIHALLAESDTLEAYTLTTMGIFLSTLSLRRATGSRWESCRACGYFYPRSPCGERPVDTRPWALTR